MRGLLKTAVGVLSLAAGVTAQGEIVPNDPYYSPYQWYHRKMNIEKGWKNSLGSPDVKIGVIDTGVVFGTPDLNGRFLPPVDALVPPGVPDTSASNLHGTWVASTIAMQINNGTGGAGTGNFSVLPIRVTNSNGNVSDTWLKQGLEIAAREDCRVITVSLSALSYFDINSYVESLQLQRRAEGSKDFLVFFAAGNRALTRSLGDPSLDNAEARLPSDHLIMVAGTDESDGRWLEGLTQGSDQGPFIDLAAPAHNILVANGIDTQVPYGLVSGTSFAAPFAASAAALAFSINPDLTAEQVRNLLFDTAFNPNNPHPGTPYWDQTYGWGRVDFGALAAAAAATVPEPASVGMLGAGMVTLLLRRRRVPGDGRGS